MSTSVPSPFISVGVDMYYFYAYLTSIPLGFFFLFWLYKKEAKTKPGPIMQMIMMATAFVSCPLWPLIVMTLAATGALQKTVRKELSNG
jgi:hypothetical protein